MASHFPSVAVIDDLLVPGLVHTVIVSSMPVGKEYKLIQGVSFDVNIADIGPEIIPVLIDSDVRYVSLRRDLRVDGRSWEMAAAMACIGSTGNYTGTVEAYADGVVLFGPVPCIDIKKRVVSNVKTSNEIKSVSLSR